MTRYSVELTGLFLAFLPLWPTLAVAGVETVYSRQYENCLVETYLDTQAVLDGEDNTESHSFYCYREKFLFSFSFTNPDDFSVSVETTPTEESREGETVSVAIRIDDAPTMRWEITMRLGHASSINDPALAYTLLDLLTTGQRAVIGVGKQSGFIPLTAHVHAAAQDFRSRLPRQE